MSGVQIPLGAHKTRTIYDIIYHMNQKHQSAFTLIELLVVIAIIGILATISIITISGSRAKARDAKRAANIKQTQTALELFFNDKGRYPTATEWSTGQLFSTSTNATSTYMQVIPTAPDAIDGNCSNRQNTFSYLPTANGSSYTISYCLGNRVGSLTPGPKCATPAGILDIDCSVSTFTMSYGNHNGYQAAIVIEQLSDGGYIIGGNNWSTEKIYLTKIDHDGNVLWTKNLGDNSYQILTAMQQTTDGGYIMAGVTYLNGAYKYYIIKADSNGDKIWSKTFGDSSQNELYDVKQIADGGYIVVGFINENYRDVYLAKLDNNGNILWSKTFGDVGGGEVGFKVFQTADNGYIIGGIDSGVNNSQYDDDYYLLKTDSSGDLIWSNVFGSDSDDQRLTDFQPTADGGYFLIGYGYSPYGSYLVKTDSNGNELWSKNYSNIAILAAKQTADGGYIMVGNPSIYLLKTDSNGNELWSKSYSDVGIQESKSIIQTSDGGYIIAGLSGDSDETYYDSYIIKTDANGNIE